VQDFEAALSTWFGVEHAVACSSGTAALHLAYAAAGVNEESLGIVPAITFSATANALKYQSAKVSFCDVFPETGLIDPESLCYCLDKISDEQKEKTNVVTPVSFAGSVAPLEECNALAKAHGFRMIEDASHSPGAWKENQSKSTAKSASGQWEDAATLSFHPVKHICCGEGGAVLTNSGKLAESAKKLRSHGISRPFGENHETPWRYEQEDLGWNYRLTDLQAALGLSQLKRLDDFLTQRRSLASRYLKVLKERPFCDHFDIPEVDPGNAWHLFVIRFKQKGKRDLAHKFLKEKNILTQVHYIPLYRHPYFERMMGKIRLPGAESFFKGCLSIPLYPQLSESEQDRVIEELGLFVNQFA
jgi:dTDP-4-amino-4,6-dideoxygalactose transaminase